VPVPPLRLRLPEFMRQHQRLYLASYQLVYCEGPPAKRLAFGCAPRSPSTAVATAVPTSGCHCYCSLSTYDFAPPFGN
jgi:hypothetical protein